ncbi:3-oxoacyl-[acyl-carrier-protein] synthase III C-terminal domain-containing protein [Chloroflexota bacterium]
MAGIAAYGVYVPLYRLGAETIGWSGRGEKAVANYDEDSITMAVAAAMNCLAGRDSSQVDGLYFASTTQPYNEGPSAAMVATAAGLRRDIVSIDFGNSLRAGTTALKLAVDAVKAGAARQILVVAADLRVPVPSSSIEPVLGDGAVALLISDTGVAVSVEDSYALSDEILDYWREDGHGTVRFWEDRFNIDMGYNRTLAEAVDGLMKKTNLATSDFARAVFYALDARRHSDMAKRLGFDGRQVQDGMFNVMGNTGAALALMLLTAAMEEAKPGERILLAGYGSGANAMLLQTTDEINGIKGKRALGRYLESKRIISDYAKYLSWRGHILTADPARRPPDEVPSPANVYRNRDRNIRFYGVKCKTCGTPLYPPVRICVNCQTRDNFEPYRFSDKKATLFTYSYDFIGRTKDPPVIIAYIDFEGGGRARLMMADGDIAELKQGMPLELTFRKLYTDTNEGIHDYYWKCTPVRI